MLFKNSFIILYVLLITVFTLPKTNHPAEFARLAMKLRETAQASIRPVLFYTGLWQNWDMFSPNPLSTNFDVEAEITFKDGSKKIWIFPKMERLGFLERYQKERYRKFREYVRMESHKVIWHDVSRWIARQFNDPENPPTNLSLIRYWTPIPAPSEHDYQPIIPIKKHTNQYIYFSTKITPEDLS
jgi:hypothetical protein